ncbi:lysophospholipid acyltransferase family protein [Owenweeksia hongkongensis]|uniref:lysophospholipid acyltransferase family protein n=1 Tax=Owenweeksia hongkongensis TaxID=253245 RepID=UPI003A8C957F
MNIISAALSSIWKVWYYTTILIAILMLFPLLVITSANPAWYKSFFYLSRVWAWTVLLLSGFIPKTTWLQKPDREGIYIICANHTSMIDIMMTLALFPNCFLFIGKKELAKFPLFGYFYKKTNLLVDRKSMRSRKTVFDRAAVKIDEGYGLCIFPEGGVPDTDVVLAPFKTGAFRLAVNKQITIIPVSFLDNKKHLPFDFAKGGPGILRAVVHPFIVPNSAEEHEVEILMEKCREAILSGLSVSENSLEGNAMNV